MFLQELKVAVVAGGLLFAPLVADASGPPPTTQPIENLRILVALALFRDDPAPSLSRDVVETMMVSQVEPFTLENSYGRIGVEATVTEWVSLPLAHTCDTGRVRQSAVAALDTSVDFRDVEHFIIIAAYAGGPAQPYCGWSGLASGTITFTTDDGQVTITHAAVHTGAVTLPVVAHELGHNLGLGHANFLDCGTRSWALTGCTVLPYADYFSVMGRSTPARDLNAYERENLGWFDPARPLVEVRGSAQVMLTPIEDANPGLKAVKIPRPNGQPLYLEYRQPIGFDQGMDQGGFSDVFDGLLLHVPRMRGHESLLIDPTPPGEPHRSALPSGATYTDPLSGIAVRVHQRTATGVVVSIVYPPALACRAPCTLSVW